MAAGTFLGKPLFPERFLCASVTAESRHFIGWQAVHAIAIDKSCRQIKLSAGGTGCQATVVVATFVDNILAKAAVAGVADHQFLKRAPS